MNVGYRSRQSGITNISCRVFVRGGVRKTQRGSMMADDSDALAQLRRESTRVGHRNVLHYLYFSRREDAATSAAALRASGFSTEERLGADGVNWLVLARHEIVPSEETIGAARTTMEELARQHGGEYDGWEVDAT
jgi:Regulator of ribonuclease activity B